MERARALGRGCLAALDVGSIAVQLPARWICACSTRRSREVARDRATSLGLP